MFSRKKIKKLVSQQRSKRRSSNSTFFQWQGNPLIKDAHYVNEAHESPNAHDAQNAHNAYDARDVRDASGGAYILNAKKKLIQINASAVMMS